MLSVAFQLCPRLGLWRHRSHHSRALQSETQQNNIESNSVNNDNIVNNNYQYHDCINNSIGKDYDDDEETQMTETVIKVMMVNWYSLYVLANVQNVPGISLQYRDTGSGHWTLHC